MINSADILFCQRCGNVLEVKTAIEPDEKRRKYDDLISAFLEDPEAQRFFAMKAREMGLWDRIREVS